MTKVNAREFCMAFLREHEYAVLATADAEGKPQAATVVYLVDPDFTIYFTTRRNTKKYANLECNARAAMVFGMGPDPVSIQLEGTAEVVEAKKQEAVMERFFTQRGSYYRIFLKIPGYDFALFKIKPDWIRLFRVEEGNTEIFTRIF